MSRQNFKGCGFTLVKSEKEKNTSVSTSARTYSSLPRTLRKVNLPTPLIPATRSISSRQSQWHRQSRPAHLGLDEGHLRGAAFSPGFCFIL